MRPLHRPLLLLVLALSLCGSVILPATGQMLLASESALRRASFSDGSTHRPPTYSHLAFPRPLPSVNDSQSGDQPVQVGAWGDESSVGNRGVQADIQTNAYNSSGQSEDAFWVGDVLNDGGFVQFGYVVLNPGYYCLTAHIISDAPACLGPGDNFGSADPRWFWAYFPSARNVQDWYYGFGPTNSAGANGTWHLYSISPSEFGNWSFNLDGTIIYSSEFPSDAASSPAHLVAEKASGVSLSQLGPVEFRNLAYLGNDSVWHGTSSLNPIDGCGSAYDGSCSTGGYGVESVGVDDVVAGSNVSNSAAGGMLWERQSSTCTINAALVSTTVGGPAPLNVTFTSSVQNPQGSTRTDWWFGDGSHQDGNSTRTVTYQTPGNYTPFVRVIDSTGCLSEAAGTVSVAPMNSSALGNSVGAVSFTVGVIGLDDVAPTIQRYTDGPS